ncbi:flavin reductase family protein [Cellulomonas sp. DKR-3]|uniref:Flavin reductase family protein n=1 Tax=Cellulomonas fulva TaxID=2835530 RepID=A0ABS5TUI2_9CELL|nr:flavin reductase family protein [Cellulomonas fulva]MBT0992801.1 flavin reductase family protein [Cellulomonas fulva]
MTPEPLAPADGFRDAVAALPAGVAVVTTTWRRTTWAMTVSSAASVSLDPPLLLFCVHADARLRDALDEVETWTLSVLAAGQGPVADWLASPGRPAVDQLARVPHHDPVLAAGARLDGAAAWFDCRTTAVHPAGDHDVVVGEVLAAQRGTRGTGGLVHLDGRLRDLR